MEQVAFPNNHTMNREMILLGHWCACLAKPSFGVCAISLKASTIDGAEVSQVPPHTLSRADRHERSVSSRPVEGLSDTQIPSPAKIATNGTRYGKVCKHYFREG
eukprot:1269717-Amphidinium_carterae.1